MGELPPYESLLGASLATLYGLIVERADGALVATYQYGWQKDRALSHAIELALSDAAAGATTSPSGKPRWLDGLVARDLRDASTSHWAGRFPLVRLMERLELIHLDVDDTYVLAMVGNFGPNKADRLRADPDLIRRALWKVFEVEGGGEVSLTNMDSYGGEWREAFLQLIADGTLDRLRVLSACLEALGRDFSAYRAGWYSATYLALEPTSDETAAFQARLRRLLAATVPATVGFALKQLGRAEKAGLLDIEATLEGLRPAVLVKAKGTAIAALDLARGGRVAYPGVVAAVALAALEHPHADVQRAAAKLLADLDHGDAVLAAATDLTPSVRQELGLQVEVPQERPTSHSQTLASVAPPVSGFDVAERAAVLLEDASDVGELEAVLGFLATHRADDAFAPLRKRATSVVSRGPRTEMGNAWLPGQVARLILDEVGDPAPPAYPEHPAQRFVVRRIGEVRAAAGPLLSTPDLPGGWISPSAFVERLAQNPSPRHYDVIAALLRLHPDGRDEAARDARGLAAAARFALDGVEPSRRFLRGGREGPAAWWLAAERSRAPFAAKAAPQLNGGLHTYTWNVNGRAGRSQSAQFTVTTMQTGRAADDQPTELMAQPLNWWGRWHTSRFLGDWVPTLAAIWPQDAEHFLSLTCLPVLRSPGSSETSHDVPRTLDSMARHPGRMGPLAAATLAAGISATQRDHRLHAVDAFIDLVLPGRIPAHEVAAVMARYAQAWPATRWAESLESVARAPGGALVVMDLLTHLLPQLPVHHRGLNKLLDLLRDELLRLGRAATDPALVTWLGGFSGGSAAARTARLVLG